MVLRFSVVALPPRNPRRGSARPASGTKRCGALLSVAVVLGYGWRRRTRGVGSRWLTRRSDSLACILCSMSTASSEKNSACTSKLNGTDASLRPAHLDDAGFQIFTTETGEGDAFWTSVTRSGTASQGATPCRRGGFRASADPASRSTRKQSPIALPIKGRIGHLCSFHLEGPDHGVTVRER
jgi:hypothetical protein